MRLSSLTAFLTVCMVAALVGNAASMQAGKPTNYKGLEITPSFDPKTIVKKPVLTDASGKAFQTSASIIDAGSVPEYKCSFPFRVPAGTKVASISIDTATINVAALDK
ncbi:MAG TPA: hypothetical protein VNT81_22740 [Vicinamibacterales bacterium]|nr:hypothetical protein [Vicinamibacterales bacterium]